MQKQRAALLKPYPIVHINDLRARGKDSPLSQRDGRWNTVGTERIDGVRRFEDAVMEEDPTPRMSEPKPAFGAWLLRQKDRVG